MNSNTKGAKYSPQKTKDKTEKIEKVTKTIGNTKVIDRYNSFRYDRPTYLTV